MFVMIKPADYQFIAWKTYSFKGFLEAIIFDLHKNDCF